MSPQKNQRGGLRICRTDEEILAKINELWFAETGHFVEIREENEEKEKIRKISLAAKLQALRWVMGTDKIEIN